MASRAQQHGSGYRHVSLQTHHRKPYPADLIRSNCCGRRIRGHFLITFGSIGDGYYGQYRLEKVDDGNEKLVVNTRTGIHSVLYSHDHVLQFLGPELILYKELHNPGPSVMHDEASEHGTYALFLGRTPHRI